MANSDETFPAADAERELNPALDKPDAVSSELADSLKTREPKEGGNDKGKKDNKCDQMLCLKKGIMMSAVVVAVIGAAVAIIKKLREK